MRAPITKPPLAELRERRCKKTGVVPRLPIMIPDYLNSLLNATPFTCTFEKPFSANCLAVEK